MNLKKERREIFNIKYIFFDLAKILHIIPGMILFRTKRIYMSEDAKKKIKGGALVISNHSAISDIIVISLAFGMRRLFFVAAKECFNTWLKNLFFKLCLCIEINRENVDTKTIRKISDTMKKGHLVAVFPEGKLNCTDEKIINFHSGPVLMALMANVPIIPVYRAPNKKSIFRKNYIVIGEQIDLRKYGEFPSMLEIENISKKLEENEKRMVEFYERTIKNGN